MTAPRPRERGAREPGGERSHRLPGRSSKLQEGHFFAPLETDQGKGDDDRSLVERIRAGDGDAFRVIVDRYGERLFRLVYGILNDWHLSEDVVQEILILVHRKIDGFDHRSSLMTWLYRIGINSALKARRRARRRSHLPLGEGFDSPLGGEEVGRELELKEIGEKLLRCLPVKLRVVVLLREWEGLKYSEMSQVLRCSRGAVEQRLHRAMVELRRVWRPAARKEWLDGR